LVEREAWEDVVQALRNLAEAKESAHKAQVDEVHEQLADVNAQWVSEKAAWEAERAQLLAQVESATSKKADAEKDREFFREQYARASGFVASVRDENQDLEKRIKIAEEQTQTGVGLIKATFELRVKTLEEDAKSWRKMAEFLIEKDQRTENDELRRRAAEEPELRARCERQEGALEADEDRIELLEAQLEVKVCEVDLVRAQMESLQKETTQLHVELNEALTKLDRIGRAGAGAADDSMDGSGDGHEFVYLCKWRPDGADESEACREVFATISVSSFFFLLFFLRMCIS
jgi:chromosome segregation ATPase